MKPKSGRRILMLLENCHYAQDPRVTSQAQTLQRHGYVVTVISPGDATEPATDHIDGVRVVRFRSPRQGQGIVGYLWEYGYTMLACWLLSLKVLMRGGFDVIHAHNPPDTFVLIAAFYKLFGKRFIFDIHDLSPELYLARFQREKAGLMVRILLWFEWLSCRFANHVIVTNESYKRVVIERNGLPQSGISVVRNGPDLDRIYRVPPDAEVREQAGLIISCVGTIGPQDGFDHLIRAMSHLVHQEERTDIYCLILGTGAALPAVKELTTECGLDEYVRFTGYATAEPLRRYLSSTDIFVDPAPENTYNDHSTTIKIMEYMAMERPVVAYDLTEHRVSAEESALYAQPNESKDLARQILTLMDDPQLRREMGARGRRRVEDALAWTHQEANLIDAYAACFGDAPAVGAPLSGMHRRDTSARVPLSGGKVS